MTKTKIDLNDLTEDHLDACRPHLGVQAYNAPCIIGTLIPKEVREESGFPQGVGINSERIKQFLDFPPEQYDDLTELQNRFDSADWDGVLKVARKYVPDMEPAA